MPQRSTSLPIELVETIFKLAVLPLNGQGEKDHLERQQTGLTLSLTSKTCQELVEPLLYRRVTLRFLYQATRFRNTLATSRAAYVSKHTKALWIICYDQDALLLLVHTFLEACGDLDHLVLYGQAVHILDLLPQRLRPYRLRELTLINPSSQPQLSYLEATRLHLISSRHINFLDLMNRLKPVLPSSAGLPNLCIEVIGDWWNKHDLPLLGRLLASKQCHILLRIHRIPRNGLLSGTPYAEAWWRLAIMNIPNIDEATLRKRIHLSVIDEQTTSYRSLTDKACRAIDNDALH